MYWWKVLYPVIAGVEGRESLLYCIESLTLLVLYLFLLCIGLHLLPSLFFFLWKLDCLPVGARNIDRFTWVNNIWWLFLVWYFYLCPKYSVIFIPISWTGKPILFCKWDICCISRVILLNAAYVLSSTTGTLIGELSKGTLVATEKK